MADKKISQLPNSSTITGEELVPIVQNGVTVQTTVSALGVYVPAGTGAVPTTVQDKLRESVSVKDFGAVGDGVTDDTAAIQAAITYCVSTGANLVFPYANYLLSSVQVLNPAYNFTMRSDGALFTGNATSSKLGIFDLVNCVDFDMAGKWHLDCANNSNYVAGLSIRSQTGSNQATTRVNISGITVRNAQLAYSIGNYNIDYQCSEISFFGCNSFACPQVVYGGGSQAGVSFIGCNFTAEYNATFAGVPLKVMLLEGGFWYLSGGELVQVSGTAGSTTIEVRPSSSTTYGNPYPIVKLANTHIESASTMLYLNNTRTLSTPVSYLSEVSFANCSGYISQGLSLLVVDATADNTYIGKIRFDNGCNFYFDGGSARTASHIAVGTNCVVDLDGSPFNSSFYQGMNSLLAGYRGKPRLRGETIVAAYGSTTSIASTSNTIVVFPTLLQTNDSVYGNATYSAGSFTAGQAMKDVQVNFQIVLASAAANADFFIAINGVNAGYYAVPKNTTLQSGSYVIPSLSSGDVVTLVGNTNTGGAVALSGGLSNFLRINART